MNLNEYDKPSQNKHFLLNNMHNFEKIEKIFLFAMYNTSEKIKKNVNGLIDMVTSNSTILFIYFEICNKKEY